MHKIWHKTDSERWIIAKLSICVSEIREHVLRFRRTLGGKVRLCAVVKANAYGFGMVSIAKCLEKDVDYFAVARVNELEKLRKGKITKSVLILAPIVNESGIEKALRLSGEITIENVSSLKIVNRIAKKMKKIAKVHIKIDTGMHRYGIGEMGEFLELLEYLKSCLNVEAVGIYSHLSSPQNEVICLKQKDCFDKFISAAREKGYALLSHLASSKKAFDKDYAYDMVRIGVDLYESPKVSALLAEIINIKKLQAGECLGYNGAYVAERDMKIACVGVGYGDVSIRGLSNKGSVLIGGKKCNIVGNVCMDCLFADVTNVDESQISNAVIWGNQGKCCISVCEVAQVCGTISYEILTSISGRVKREVNICKSSQENIVQGN